MQVLCITNETQTHNNLAADLYNPGKEMMCKPEAAKNNTEGRKMPPGSPGGEGRHLELVKLNTMNAIDAL